MSVEITTTKSVWFYDNVYEGYHQGTLFSDQMPCYLVLKYQNDYYAISNPNIQFTETGITLQNGGSSIKYDAASMRWGSSNTFTPLPSAAWSAGEIPFSNISICSQNIDSSKPAYYSTAQFRSGNVNAPTGSIVDGIYTHNVLDGVLGVLPVLLVVLIGFIAIRKGIAFLGNLLKGV